MNKNIYLTCDDYNVFHFSNRVLSAKRIRIGIITYIHVRTEDMEIIGNERHNEFLLTKWYFFVASNYLDLLPIEFDAYLVKKTTNGNIQAGEGIARLVYLHE